MSRFRHLFPTETASREPYRYAKKVGRSEFTTPPRDDRHGHGSQLIGEIGEAERESQEAAAETAPEEKPKGSVLDFSSEPGFKLQLQSLEMRRSGIELCNSRMEGEVMHAAVFVPEGKIGLFVKKFESYIREDTKKGQPKNRDLAESISHIRNAALESFWTDAGPFPEDKEERLYWEVWLREASNPHDVSEQFRAAAETVGIEVRDREIDFPERRVLLIRASIEQLTQVVRLFDWLAELRLAKQLATEFVDMPPHEQAALIERTLQRVQAPPTDAPAVCHLDTGVNRGHPLLAVALSEGDALACNPDWPSADTNPQQHGTAMAGLALYGCLTEVFSSDDQVRLQHRLESVKILSQEHAHEPDLFGEVTDQAMSRIEVASPNRPRVACLTVTADGRDEGFPSSWSAALDQTCAGVEDGLQRLVVVSAGNTPPDGRHDYPNWNHLHGIEDPGQAFNVITVGAYTERAVIQAADFNAWQPVAEPGKLSPSSRTSIVWRNKSWPLKPDLVMEGGNMALDPGTGHADYVDDLLLLTTRLSATGAMLTTSGDTSAAAALASRYAAMIYARYRDLRPETVRALLIHSARWTDAMRTEFPDRDRHNRLRCYGFGVPNLDRALWSAESSATLIVEGALQPYEKEDGTVRTRDMHLHRLPWPTEVLQDLGEVEISMRVTLSYFIEPSPGQRGWTRRHRYQSHGLRFEVKHPLETDGDFHKRISRAAWDEDEEAVDSLTEDRNWELGQQLRCKGSIHSDTWSGTAAQLSQCGVIAVFPVTGWWKERPHLEGWRKQARYSLVVTLETPRQDIDLYTPIAIAMNVPVEAVVEA